jgi:hypothetical protein
MFLCSATACTQIFNGEKRLGCNRFQPHTNFYFHRAHFFLSLARTKMHTAWFAALLTTAMLGKFAQCYLGISKSQCRGCCHCLLLLIFNFLNIKLILHMCTNTHHTAHVRINAVIPCNMHKMWPCLTGVTVAESEGELTIKHCEADEMGTIAYCEVRMFFSLSWTTVLVSTEDVLY